MAASFGGGSGAYTAPQDLGSYIKSLDWGNGDAAASSLHGFMTQNGYNTNDVANAMNIDPNTVAQGAANYGYTDIAPAAGSWNGGGLGLATGTSNPYQYANSATPEYLAANGVTMGANNPNQVETYTQPQQNLGLGGGVEYGSPKATFGGSPATTSAQTPQTAYAPPTQQTAQQGYQQNPYLKQYGDALTAQSVQNFNQGVLPQIRAGAQAAGQYGSSRQGIAEGVAAGNASTGLGANLAQLYSQGYNTDTSSALQNKSLDNSFYTTNRGLDLSQYQLGANLTNQGITGQQNLGKGVYEGGNTYQNAPLQNLNNYSNLVNPYTGLNGSKVGTDSAGGGLNGAIGGGMTAAKLIALLSSGDPTTLKNLGLSS